MCCMYVCIALERERRVVLFDNDICMYVWMDGLHMPDSDPITKENEKKKKRI